MEHDPPGVGGEVRQAEIRERRLGDDGDRRVLCEIDERQRQDVRQEVTKHDPRVARAGDLRALDVGALLQREDFPPYHDAVVDPRFGDDREDDVGERDPPDRDQDDHERQEGQSVGHVGDPLDRLVDPGVAVVARDQTQGHADETREDPRRERDVERVTRGVDQQRQDVPALVVGAEGREEGIAEGRRVGEAPTLLAGQPPGVVAEVRLPLRSVRGEHLWKQRPEHVDRDDRQPDEPEPVASEAVPGPSPALDTQSPPSPRRLDRRRLLRVRLAHGSSPNAIRGSRYV